MSKIIKKNVFKRKKNLNIFDYDTKINLIVIYRQKT